MHYGTMSETALLKELCLSTCAPQIRCGIPLPLSLCSAEEFPEARMPDWIVDKSIAVPDLLAGETQFVGLSL